MISLTSEDSQVICRIQLTGDGRWVSLALSLGDVASSGRLVVAADRLLYEMAGVDEGARALGLAGWQGGVVSGARYAFRALKAPIKQIYLHELRGQLSAADVGAVSSAAALAVARLLARAPEFPLDLGGWAMAEEFRGGASAASPAAPPTNRNDTHGDMQSPPTDRPRE